MKCDACGQDMETAETCIDTTIKFADGMVLPSSTYHFSEASGRCHDCGIRHRGCHHSGCDVERCPRCGRQLISCYCELWEEEKEILKNGR